VKIEEYYKSRSIVYNIPSVKEELEVFKKQLEQLSEQIDRSVKDSKIEEYPELLEEAESLKHQFDESSLFKEYAKHRIAKEFHKK
jgi:hypothetical protein